jgi:hypothetical protein
LAQLGLNAAHDAAWPKKLERDGSVYRFDTAHSQRV